MGHLDRSSPAGHQWQHLRGQPLQVIIIIIVVIIAAIAIIVVIVVVVIIVNIFVAILVNVVAVMVIIVIIVFVVVVIIIITIIALLSSLPNTPFSLCWPQLEDFGAKCEPFDSLYANITLRSAVALAVAEGYCYEKYAKQR